MGFIYEKKIPRDWVLEVIRFHEGDIVEGFYRYSRRRYRRNCYNLEYKDGNWEDATVSCYDSTRPNMVNLLWHDGTHSFVKVKNVRRVPLRKRNRSDDISSINFYYDAALS